MKELFAIATLSVLLVFVTPYALASDKWHTLKKRRAFTLSTMDEGAMLWAIRQVESGDNPLAIGQLGERTAYQFMPATWRMYSTVRFAHAGENPLEADRVALEHLRSIRRYLYGKAVRHRAEQVAAAWAYGPGYALMHQRSDYAQRVANLYFDYLP